jgi:LuxR family maltose regulon positive regulatory protein
MALQEARLAGNPFTFLEVTTYLVEVLWIQGRLKEAVEICEEGLRFIDKNKLGSAPMSGKVLLGFCFLCCERYDLRQAEESLDRGLRLAGSVAVAMDQAWGCYVKMRYLVARGDFLAAEIAASEAGSQSQISELPLWVGSGISALKALIWVRLGKLDEAGELLEKRGILADSEIQYSYQREYLSLAALLIAKDDFGGAGNLLDRLTGWAEARKQNRTVICALTLKSIMFVGRKEMQKALQSLASAMELAEPEGYLLTILEMGEAIAPVLYQAVQKGIHPSYANRLLAGFKETYPFPLEKPETQKSLPGSLTPLRPREIEVLKLAADGLTNKEIANQLHLSLRTVKFHMTSLFNKLGVDNRMQAVTKAKTLGILQ